MIKQLIIGFCTEGSTDKRFLESVIQRTFEKIAFESNGQIDILPIIYLEKKKGSFVEIVNQYAQVSFDLGVMILCVHADADSTSDKDVFEYKIEPAFEKIIQGDRKNICTNLVATVPVQMTEAWMLADTDLLKNEIGTTKTKAELGISKKPESFSDPKKTIQNAILEGRKNQTKRRRKTLSISELYQPIGQKIDLEKLEKLESYIRFKNAVKDSMRNLGYFTQ